MIFRNVGKHPSKQRRILEQRPCQNLRPPNQLFYPRVGKGKTARLDFVWAEKQIAKGGGGGGGGTVNMTADVGGLSK